MKFRDTILLLLLGAIWGSSFLFLKIATPVAGVYTTVAFRIILAAVVMSAIFFAMKKLPDYKKLWKKYLVLALLNLIIPFGLVTFSINYLASSTVAILNATTPLFALIVGYVWLGEAITLKKVAGIFLALAGLVVLLGWMPVAFTPEVMLSIVLSLLAALSYAVAGVFIKAKIKGSEPVKTATGQITTGAVLLLPVFLFQDPVYNAGWDILGALIALGLISTAFAYILFFQLIQRVTSTNASLVTVVVPVFSTIWGVLFLNEPVTYPIMVGLLLIVVSLLLVVAPASKEKTSTYDKPATLHCYYCLN